MLLTALDGHFEQTELLLTELLNAPEDAERRFGFERTTADDLVASGRLYRITAEQIGKQHLAAMLDELEPVLVDVARSPEKVESQRSQISALANRRRGPALQSAGRDERNPRAPTGNHHDTRGQLMKRLVLFVAIRRLATLAAAHRRRRRRLPRPRCRCRAVAAARAADSAGVRAPRPVMAPVYIDESRCTKRSMAAREAQQIDVRTRSGSRRARPQRARSAARDGAISLREMQFARRPNRVRTSTIHFSFQDRMFAMTFGQEGDGDSTTAAARVT